MLKPNGHQWNAVKHRKTWSNDDRRRFADHNLLRAQTIQGKRFEGPKADEWEEALWTS